jgi:hypothetical protein
MPRRAIGVAEAAEYDPALAQIAKAKIEIARHSLIAFFLPAKVSWHSVADNCGQLNLGRMARKGEA